MTGLVERIARVLDPDAFQPFVPGHEDCPNCLRPREEAERKAREVLSAVREPTEAMVDRGQAGIWDCDVSAIFTAMIDEALK